MAEAVERVAGHTGGRVDRAGGAAQRDERRDRVLTQGKPSVTRSIADAIVIKDGDLFFLSEPDGQVPLDRHHGLGLYHGDCRYLSGYELHLAGRPPNLLAAATQHGFATVFEFSNPDIVMHDGGLVPAEEIGITWSRILDGKVLALHERIGLRSLSLRPVEFGVSLTFRAGFEDVYIVRGLLDERPGVLEPPVWQDGVLYQLYRGADGRSRSVVIRFSPAPGRVESMTAHFDIALGPREEHELAISVHVAESDERGQVFPARHRRPDLSRLRLALERGSDHAVRRATSLQSDSLLLNAVVERSLRDLRMLESHLHGRVYVAAGLPWFGTLFGRDSLITALQMLAFEPRIAEQTLRILAAYQGDRVDAWRDMEPGKILHELRVGELARLGEIPHTPYYGTVDATPLFLVLVGRHAAWRGTLDIFHELREPIERALRWVDEYGDLDGDGYVEYRSTSAKGLVNQGWKDSGDAIVNADGSLARPPIALVEVQGYVYLAKTLLAGLYRRAGEADRADALEREAAELRERFNRDFWQEQLGTFALALQAGNEPVAVASSNPAHALWTGIADEDKAKRTVARLMEDDLFSGWGVRTLSTRERRYNPIGYHLGSVWPHDNAIVAAGFKRFGGDRAALRIFSGILEAAMHFEDYRLPELFAGYARDEFGIPVHYPVACHPQAWAAGSVPYLVQTALGLEPDAFQKTLRIVRPRLPHFVDRIVLDGLRVGDARVGLRFERVFEGVDVQVLRVDGDLEVEVEPAPAIDHREDGT